MFQFLSYEIQRCEDYWKYGSKKRFRKVSETRNMIKIYYMHVCKCDSDFHIVLLVSDNKKKKMKLALHFK